MAGTSRVSTFKAGPTWGRTSYVWLIVLANILARASLFPKRGWETFQGECVAYGPNLTGKGETAGKCRD